MFVRYYVELSFPYPGVARAMAALPEAWLAEMAREANVRGETLLLEHSVLLDGDLAGNRMQVAIGPAGREPERTIIPMSWWAAERYMPLLEGQLEAAPLGRRRTQLAVSAYYRVASNSRLHLLDRMLLHRVVEAVVKCFVDRVCGRSGSDAQCRAASACA